MQGAGKGKEKMTLMGRSDDSNQDEWGSIYEQKKICAGRREKPLRSSRSPLGTLLPVPFDQPSESVKPNQGKPSWELQASPQGGATNPGKKTSEGVPGAILVTVWALKVSRALLIHYKELKNPAVGVFLVCINNYWFNF